MRRLTLTLVVLLAAVLGVKADEAFRNHRFDGFKPLDVNENSIVFLGNSITNMNEWRECFGNNPNILGRGNSGGLAYEWIDFYETVFAGHPKAIFYGLGVNDMRSNRTNQQLSEDVHTFIQRCLDESPNTEIFIQSIHPTSNGTTVAAVKSANDAVKAMIDATFGANPKVHFLDVQEAMKNIPSGGDYSYDRLHLTGKSYAIWCHAQAEAAQAVGIDLTCTLPAVDDVKQSNAGVGNNSFGMRTTLFSVLPVTENDILFIGGETIHGAEWHEYFANNNVKNRGTGWDADDLTLANHKAQLEQAILGNLEGGVAQTAPAKILFYAGYKHTFTADDYKSLLTATDARLKALKADNQTKIYAISMLSWNGCSDYADRNEKIRAAVEAAKAEGVNVEYVDLTADMMPGGTMPAEYIPGHDIYGKYNGYKGSYPSGKGYAKMAELLAAKCEIAPDAGRTSVTSESAAANIARFDLRKELVRIIKAMGSFSVGDRTTDLTQEKYDELQPLLQSASQLLKDSGTTNEQLQAKVAELNAFEAITAAPPTEEGWYNIVATAGKPFTMGFPYVTNVNKLYKQSNTNWYALRFAEYDANNPAKHLVYITPKKDATNVLQIQGSAGLYATFQGLSQTAPADITVKDGHIGDWYTYDWMEDDAATEKPYVGGNSDDNTSKFVYVKADVSPYKIYKVHIVDVIHSENAVAELPNVIWADPTGERNMGVSAAFDGGYYFVNPDRMLQPDEDLSKLFSAPIINGKAPVIYLDKEGGFNDPVPDEDDENYVAPTHTAEEYDLIVIDYSDDNQVLDISELDTPGYYRIEITMLSGSRTNEMITEGRNIVKAAEPENYFWQSGNNGNSYGAYFDASNAESPATEFVYISKKADSDYAEQGYNFFDVRMLNGHYVSNLGPMYADAEFTNSWNNIKPIRIGKVPNITGKFNFGSEGTHQQWNSWTNNNINYLAGSSSAVNRYEIIKVLPDELDQYDIYVVNIDESVTKAATSDHVRNRLNDVKVTLGYTEGDAITPIQGNMGLQSVYNNGRFFVAKGTELIPTHFHVSNATEPEATYEFKVTIGEKKADGEIPVTITIGEIVTEDDLFNDPDNHADALITQAGWYKIKAAALSGGDELIVNGNNWILNAENECRQNGTSYYPLKLAAANTELGATNHVYIDPAPTADNQFNIYGLDGHYISNLGKAQLPSIDNATGLTLYKTEDGQPNLFAIGGYWGLYSPNLADYTEQPYIAGYSGQRNNRFEIAHVAPDEMALYNIYKVSIVGGDNDDTEIGRNTRVTLDIPRNKGIRKVYDGGFFFVEKGDPLTSADFTPDAIEGKSVAVTIGEAVTNEADGLDYIPVTVTYGDAITGITVSGIEETAEGSEEVTYATEKALGLNVPVTISGTVTSPGTPAIEPALFSVKDDLSETGLSVSDFTVDGLKWSVTLTPSQPLTEAKELTFTYGRTAEDCLEAEQSVSVTVLPNAARVALSLEGLTPTVGNDGIPRYSITAGSQPLKPLYELYDNVDGTGTPMDNTAGYIDVDFYYNFIGDPVTIEPGETIEVSQPGVMIISAVATNPDGSKALVQDLRVSITQGEVTGITALGVKVEAEDGTVSYLTEATVSISESFTVAGKILPDFAYVDKTLFAVEGNGATLPLTDTYQEGSEWAMTFNPLQATEEGQPIVLTFKYNKNGVDPAAQTVRITIRPNASTGTLSIAPTAVAVGDVITPSVTFDVANPHISAPEYSFEPADAVTVETADDGTVTFTAAKAGEVTVSATATNLNGSFIAIDPVTLDIAYATPSKVTIDSESLPEKEVILGDEFTLAAATDKENPAYVISYSFDPADAVETVTATDEDGNVTTSYRALKTGEVKVTASAAKDDHTLTSEPVTVTLAEPEPAEIPEELIELLEEITEGNKEEIAAILEEIKEAAEEGAEIDIDIEDLKGHIMMEIEIDAEEMTTVALPHAATGEAAKELFYKSSNPEIAEVDQSGNITAKMGGRVLITMQIHLAAAGAPATQASLAAEDEEAAETPAATEPEGKLLATHIYLVSVKEKGKIESVETPESVTLTPAETTTIPVKVNDGADATTIEWTSDSDNVTIEPSEDGLTLTITAGSEDGDATITGTYTDGFGKTQTIEIPVTVARKGSTIVGIDEINADITAGRREVYDLQGRRVTGVVKAGLYIIGGVKTFIR